MASIIKLKRSNVPGKQPLVEDLELGELALNSFDGTLFLKKQQDTLESIVKFVGETAVENVIFVQKNGNDSNNGSSWNNSVSTIEKALELADAQTKQKFLTHLGGGINRWRWNGADWEQWQDTTTLRRFEYTVADFPDAPVPPKPDWNPDERESAQARAAASLSCAQFKLALLTAGYLDAVEAAYPTWPRNVQIMWDDSSTFERMHPALIQLAESMGYTPEQMDAIFGIDASPEPTETD